MHDLDRLIADAWHHRNPVVRDNVPQVQRHRPDLALRSARRQLGAGEPGGCTVSGFYWPFGIACRRVGVLGHRHPATAGSSAGQRYSRTRTSPPTFVLGQPDVASHAENRDGPRPADSFRWPHDLTGRDDLLLVADAGDHRVLGWSPQPAGRPSRRSGDRTAISPAPRNGPTGHTKGPDAVSYAVCLDGQTLAVADTANNRIPALGRHAGRSPDPTQTRCGPSDHVLAQPDFGSNGEPLDLRAARHGMLAYGLSLHGDTWQIADSGNNRVMLWRRG